MKLARPSTRPEQPKADSRTAVANRRRSDRQPATGTVLICPGNEGAVVDRSADGFAIESNLAVRVGATYQLRLWLGAAHHPVAGIVRWSRLNRTIVEAGVESDTGSAAEPRGDITPVFRSGFELVKLSPGPQTGVNCDESESPISTPAGKYSFQR